MLCLAATADGRCVACDGGRTTALTMMIYEVGRR